MPMLESSVDPIQFLDWGLIDYQAAHEQQMDLVQKRIRGEIGDTVVFCSHPPVVTLGRASKPDDLQGWAGEVVEVQRGGRATYHGPGQLIGYPIFSLVPRGRDLHKYIRFLETVLIRALKEYGLEADGARSDATGVWVGSKKIASIGVGVKSWVTFHGFALNFYKDPIAFQGINPCGFRTSDMTCLEDLIPEKISIQEFKNILKKQFTLQ